MSFQSCRKFFAFSFSTFGPTTDSTPFPHPPAVEAQLQFAYCWPNNLLFLISWFRWANILSRTPDSSRSFYRTWGRLNINKQITGICRVIFFHDDLLHNRLVLFVEEFADNFDFFVNYFFVVFQFLIHFVLLVHFFIKTCLITLFNYF